MKLTRYCLFLVLFMVMNDEHCNPVINNILQVKERGATIIVCTTLEDISTKINTAKIDYLIKLAPQDGILSALTAIPVL